jgi:hypothetical protein
MTRGCASISFLQATVQFRKMHARNAAKTMLLLGVVMAALGLLLLIAIGLGVQ